MLKPEVSMPIALATAGVVYSIYSNATPSIAEIRQQEPGDMAVDKSRKTATWAAAGVVSAISLLAKDPTIFVIGSGMVVLMDWATRHANIVNPKTQTATAMQARELAVDQGVIVDAQTVSPDNSNIYV